MQRNLVLGAARVSSIVTIALERRAKSSVLVRQIENGLRQACGLDDTPDFDGALVFDQSSDRVDQVRRELLSN
jgi:hypothetical protein